jgi:hypothetical protein
MTREEARALLSRSLSGDAAASALLADALELGDIPEPGFLDCTLIIWHKPPPKKRLSAYTYRPNRDGERGWVWWVYKHVFVRAKFGYVRQAGLHTHCQGYLVGVPVWLTHEGTHRFSERFD